MTSVARGLLVVLVLGLGGCRLAGPAPVPVPTQTDPEGGTGAPPPPPPDSAAAVAPSAPTPAVAPPSASPRAFREVRALWVVRTTLTSPERVRQAVREAAGLGANTLIVQVRGRADAWYAGGLEPRAEQLLGRPDFDPLALLIDEAHAAGLDVHAWLATHLVWGVGPLPRDPTHLVRARPDLVSVPRELARELAGVDPADPRYLERLHAWTVARRDRLEGLYSEPASAEVRTRVVAVVEDLVSRYPLDGVHLDYVRYPSPEFGYSRTGLTAFRLWLAPRLEAAERVRLEASRDPLAWVEARPREFDRFRTEQITRLVEAVRAVTAGRGVTLSAAVFADPDDARRARFQDWPSWLADGRVDVVAPMAYTADMDRFRRLVGRAREADPTGGSRVWMGVGVYLAPFESVVDQIAEARWAGLRGVALFSYDWAAHEARPVDGVPYLRALSERAFGSGR